MAETSNKNLIAMLLIVALVLAGGCGATKKTVPHEARYGIYELGLATQDVTLIYSSAGIGTSALRLNSRGDTIIFDQKIGGRGNEHSEIVTVGTDGRNFKRLTNNTSWDIYPVWSPDDSEIAFLSFQADLDIYVMHSNGSNMHKLYDSGSHDADVSWAGDNIAFTSNSSIWVIRSDGTGPIQITKPPKAGEWGNSNLPFGDYDPRLSTDGRKIVFERLEDDSSPHGNYNLYTINIDGSGETRLTDTGYSQGLASWSNSGNRIVYTVAAANDEGRYDIYIINADGTGNHNIMPDYFPANFLAHAAIFSKDDSKIFFIGEWWE